MNMKHQVKKWALALSVILTTGLLWSEDPPRYGIKTDFGDVMIDNVGIGQTYNLRDIAGKPLKVTNSGSDAVNLLMDVRVPKEEEISKPQREIGFKPIPSNSWVSLSQSQFVVPPGESAFSDVILSIPNDPALYGKKFQVSIYSRSVGKGFMHVGVWSHLFLSVIQSPEAQAEMEKNRKKGFIGTMDYTLLPDKLVIQNTPLGRKIDIGKEIKRTMRLVNSGNDPIELRVKVIPVGDSPIGLQEGFEEAKNLMWLTHKSETYRVEPSSFVDPGFTLELPNDPSLQKKKIMFVIKVDPADPDIVGVTFYGKIYVEIQ